MPESFWVTPAAAASVSAWFWTSRALRGQKGVHKQAVITTAVTAGIYSAQRVCAVGKEENGPCGHLYPFLLLCLMPNTGEYIRTKESPLVSKQRVFI